MFTFEPGRRFVKPALIGLFCWLILVTPVAVSASNDAYGEGNYNACTYQSCPLTLTSSSTVSLNVTPASNPTCTVQSDSVSVLTDASTGYSLTFQDSTTNNSMLSGSNSVAASSAPAATPATLSSNTWGYRVDGQGSFGAGPTSAVSNGGLPSQTFAYVPTSSQAADTLASTSSAADPAVVTPVWYGICVTPSTVAGTYSSSVVYTAVIN